MILIVDDDAHIRDVVRFALEKAGFEVCEAADGEQALQMFSTQSPELIVLDIMMPGMDGTEVCRRIRREASTPIVFLSSKDDEIDRILGLELGGDDYVSKPFSPRELVARIKAVLRRIEEAREMVNASIVKTLQKGRLSLDLDAYNAQWVSENIILTTTEFGLLRTLLQRPGKAFSRDELMQSAYDFHNIVSDRTIDSHIRRLRAKLQQAGAETVIETVHGVGYKLGTCL